MSNEFAAFASGIVDHARPEAEKYDHVVFVAPASNVLPTSDMLTFTTIDSLRDIGGVAAGSVIVFGEDQAKHLAVLCSNAALFHMTVKALRGLPGLDYAPWFADATFAVQDVAYGPLASEWAAHRLVEETKVEGAKSGTERERERYTRANGNVKFAEIGDASRETNDLEED